MQQNNHIWIPSRNKEIERALASLGLGSIQELMRSSLLIHLSYGGNTDDGVSVCAKVDRVLFNGDSIHFYFERDRIEVDFSIELDKTPGGAFEGFNEDETIQIDGLTYSASRRTWVANFWYEFQESEACDSLNEENLQVEIVRDAGR